MTKATQRRTPVEKREYDKKRSKDVKEQRISRQEEKNRSNLTQEAKNENGSHKTTGGYCEITNSYGLKRDS